MKTSDSISAFVLAGGKSTRMGTDKGLIPLADKTMVETVVDAIKSQIFHITIVANNPVYSDLGYPVIEDEVKEIGPMGGLYTALKNCKTPYLFLCACDMPLIQPGMVKELVVRHQTGHLVAESHGKTHPLFGIYAVEILPIVEAFLQEMNYVMQSLVDTIGASRYDFSHSFPYDPLFNCNRPSDVIEARRKSGINLDSSMQNIDKKQISIKIMAFGMLKEIQGLEGEWRTCAEEVTELLSELKQKFPALNTLPFSVAINHQMRIEYSPLNHLDEVALLPPFSGG